MWGRTCVPFFFFFLFWLKELKLLCDSWRLGQPAFLKMHVKDDSLLPEYHWLAEPLNKLWEGVWDGGRIYSQLWTYWQLYTCSYYLYIHHCISSFLQVLALNGLKVKWIAIKGVSKIILRYLTEGISLLCVLSRKNTGRLKKKAVGLRECIKPQ